MLEELIYKQNSSLDIYVDNQSAIKLAKNPESHRRNKHVDAKYHFVRDDVEIVESKLIGISYVEYTFRLANFLTKSLTKEKKKAADSC